MDSQGTLRIFVNGRQVAKGPNIQTQVPSTGGLVNCWGVLGSKVLNMKRGEKKMSQTKEHKLGGGFKYGFFHPENWGNDPI